MNKPDYINGSHTYSLLKCILEKISNKEFILDNNYVEIYKKINPIKSKLDRNAMYKLFYANQMLFNSIINTEKYDQVYNMLADKESKKVFDWLLEYKITFAFNEELSCAYYTRAIVKSDQNIIQSIDDSYFKIKKYCIRSPYNSVYETWVLQEYFHEKCKVLPTDIVISGGAFNGESSIWFADKAYLGKVYAFEPSKVSYGILCENIRDNNLEARIVPINSAVSDENMSLYFKSDYDNQDGPGSICIPDKADYKIETISVDEFVQNQKIERVDFIKLDIEGSELDALHGAIHTLKTYQPKLAICVYHKPEDILTIPLFLKELGLGYSYYLSQDSLNTDIVDCWYHTILFAVPPQ